LTSRSAQLKDKVVIAGLDGDRSSAELEGDSSLEQLAAAVPTVDDEFVMNRTDTLTQRQLKPVTNKLFVPVKRNSSAATSVEP